jgi:uncharacterized protein YcbX
MASGTVIGSVVSLMRYPVKSMQGEELGATEVTERGLCGDRAYALVDESDGKVASAKNPKKWPNLFDFRASFVDQPRPGQDAAAARIGFPDGRHASTGQPDIDSLLSAAVGRAAHLRAVAPPRAMLEEYWPAIEGLAHQDKVTDEPLPEGTFFDLAVVHLLTTATIDRFRELYPQGRFETRRFRPNIVVALADAGGSFAENAWFGRKLQLGNDVLLNITGPCGRCVMTTLAQADLPKDAGILRAAVQHNQGGVGVYASVEKAGALLRGDEVKLV